jgi:hypothetical protein
VTERMPSHAEPDANQLSVLSPIALASLFGDLVDALIPGNENWPSGSAVGVHGLLLARLVDEWGEEEPRLVADALLAEGGPLAGHDPAKRREIVGRFEATRPNLFAKLHSAVVLAYYESPLIAEAIRKLGRPYQLHSHLTGYPSRPFDPARDTPTHKRGSFVATDAVARVDLSRLDLETTRTEPWGIKR